MEKRTDILIAALGLAFWWPFLRNSVTGFVLTVPVPDVLGRQSVFCVFMAVAVLASVVGARRGRRRGVSPVWGALPPAAVVALCAATSTASLTAVCATGTARLVVQIAGALLMAVAYVALPLVWGGYIGQRVRGVRSVLLLLLGSYALSFVVGYLSYLPAPFTYIRPVGAPIVSGVSWWLCVRRVVRAGIAGCDGRFAGTSFAGRERAEALHAPCAGVGYARSLYALALVFFLVSSIATGFINTGSVAYVPSENTLVRDTLSLVVTGCLAAAVAIALPPGWGSSGRTPASGGLPGGEVSGVVLMKLQFVFIALLGVILFAGIFIATFLGDGLFAWGTGLMQASKSCFSLVLFELVLLGTVSLGRPVPWERSLPLFVIPTIASSFISYVVVPVAVEAFAITYDGFWGTMSLTMGFALGVFLFVYLSSLAIRGVSGDDAPDGRGTAGKGADGVLPGGTAAAGTDPVSEVARAHDLTARESEVLALLLEGNTYKKIAELLGVSENTIQFHSKNIYRKFDVHTKQQLVDCIGRSRKG